MTSRDYGPLQRRKHARTASTSAILVADEQRSRNISSAFLTVDRDTLAMNRSNHIYDPPDASSSSFGLRANATASKLFSTMKRQFSLVKRRDPDILGRNGMYSTPEESSPAPSTPSFRYTDTPETRITPEQIAMGLHLSRTPHLRHVSASASQHTQSDPAIYLPNLTPRSRSPSSRYHHHGYHHQPRRSTASLLPPPPARSSMKKSSTDTSASTPPIASTPRSASTASLSASTSTVATSNAPSTPRSTRELFRPLKLRIPKFMPGSKNSISTTTSMSDTLSRSSSSRKVSFAAGESATSLGSGSLSSETPRKTVRFTATVVPPPEDEVP
ncbi:hypothetical protein JAAARDRAFT_30837 [Jaapia argillacea MUCL 33604]|uniref:Uncharacterized protein n=1 Tax=Jaapia argillacea MUCL 33604 TaxID=933084 RepID=A0A067Q2V8_9AGAM|nr:hypothetical protein JAAARDRAFT_30837 [Jaapia argillacea MUCL 33604]